MGLIKRSFLPRRPQEIGRIKIGGLGEVRNKGKKNEFQLPEKFDHFVVAKHVRGRDNNYVRDDEIHGKLGTAKPTELRAILMFDKPEENFHSEMALWRGRGKEGKVLSCDGETATNVKTGETGPCPLASGKEYCARIENRKGEKEPCTCKPYGRLHLQLWDSPHTLGYHVFRTTSWESVNNIQTTLEDIYERFGTCYQAPVKLVAYPSEDRYEGGVSTSLKVGLVLAMGIGEAAQYIGKRRLELAAAKGETKLLAAAVREDQEARDEEDEDLIAAEFAPPSTVEILDDVLHMEDDDPDEAPEVGTLEDDVDFDEDLPDGPTEL